MPSRCIRAVIEPWLPATANSETAKTLAVSRLSRRKIPSAVARFINSDLRGQLMWAAIAVLVISVLVQYALQPKTPQPQAAERSEERRVGKEWRTRRWPCEY